MVGLEALYLINDDDTRRLFVRTFFVCLMNWGNCHRRSPFKSADLYKRYLLEVFAGVEIAITASSCMWKLKFIVSAPAYTSGTN